MHQSHAPEGMVPDSIVLLRSKWSSSGKSSRKSNSPPTMVFEDRSKDWSVASVEMFTLVRRCLLDNAPRYTAQQL